MLRGCGMIPVGFAFAAVLVGCSSEHRVCDQRQESRFEPRLVFGCRPDNDLYRVLADNGICCPRYDTPTEAVDHAPAGAGVLVMADGYPEVRTVVDPSLFDTAGAKRLRLYIEYADSLPGIALGQPRGVKWERAVVSSDFFAPALDNLRILCIHGCRFTPVEMAKPHLVLARVAGYDTAVFGLPEKTFPVLFEHPRGDMLVATPKLSQFVTGRYGPASAWQSVWHYILAWLCPDVSIPPLAWRPTVRPTYNRETVLPADAGRQALMRGIAWFRKAGMLVDCSHEKEVAELAHHPDRGACLQEASTAGDGTCGLLEGYSSIIDAQGRQPVRYARRNDCTGESAMAFAFAGKLEGNGSASTVAGNLMDFIYFKSTLAQGPRSDPRSPSFGLVGWMTHQPRTDVYYGDDDARSMLGTMASAALLGESRWDEPLLRCLLANLRTTGTKGFRGNRLEEKALQARGWKYYFERDITNYAPHYEAYLWACFLWAYRHTGYEPFLQRAETAIRMTMNAYPDRWRWTNGIQQERSRMLLPLAWLVRIEDTPEHRAWLKQMASDLVADQDASGALREEIGDSKMGSYMPPQSNAQYGTNETSLLQEHGDPVCDLLYTTNFAFLGLHEAASATKDSFYGDAEDKLSQFLCRVQVRSETHPELDGAWFRAFDFDKWEYWASNGDSGWGAWCIETGWTQAWITSVLAMREVKTSLWDLTAGSQIKDHFAKLRAIMLPAAEAAHRATNTDPP